MEASNGDRRIGTVRTDHLFKPGLSYIAKEAKPFVAADYKRKTLNLETLSSAWLKDISKISCSDLRIDSSKQEHTKLCGKRWAKPYLSCFFLQRVGGQMSAQHAFNHCAYG